MKNDIIKQIEGYSKIIEEIEISRKSGSDVTMEQGEVLGIINKFHPKSIEVKVDSIIDETPTAKTIRLVAVNGYLPPFQAGQYIAIYLEVDGIRTSRPYSISSSPNQSIHYDITIKKVENGYISNYLLEKVKEGDTFYCSGPEGYFYHNPVVHDKELVCIAGGSGITPFMSMLRDLTERGLDKKIYLFYGNKSNDDIIFHKELEEFSKNNKNVNYYPVIESPNDKYKGLSGYIDGKLIKEKVGSLTDKTFFLCGPQAMYDFCILELQKLSIPLRKIRKEMYGPPAKISESKGWPENINEDDEFELNIVGSKKIKVKAGVSLLTSLENAGELVQSVCRSGECSMCRLKLVSGEVFQPEGTPVRKSDRDFGYIHSCVSYPVSDLKILIQ